LVSGSRKTGKGKPVKQKQIWKGLRGVSLAPHQMRGRKKERDAAPRGRERIAWKRWGRRQVQGGNVGGRDKKGRAPTETTRYRRVRRPSTFNVASQVGVEQVRGKVRMDQQRKGSKATRPKKKGGLDSADKPPA